MVFWTTHVGLAAGMEQIMSLLSRSTGSLFFSSEWLPEGTRLQRLCRFQHHHRHRRQADSIYFQKDRDTIEKRSGRWLKELACQNQAAGFDLNAWIPAWEAGSIGRLVPGRN